MTQKNKNAITKAFLKLLQAGFWEKDVELREYGFMDFAEIMRLAEEQSVVGIVTAGLEHVKDIKVPQEWTLQFIGTTLQIELRNKEMNAFVERLISRMREAGIYVLLIKGQGVAQSYEKPLWRSCGDVDLFLSDENYEKAKTFLISMAEKVEQEADFKKHLGLYIEGWLVELHGRLRNGLSSRIDRALDEIQKDTFYSGNVRSCMVGKTQVFLLSAENDIIYVFSHILDHFYKGGIGLRQICDWSRLIWKYREMLDTKALYSRISKMGLMSEWKAFGSFAVKYLGMPKEAMPMYEATKKWEKKADKICEFILKVGNFGQNRDMNYLNGRPFVERKAVSLKQRVGDVMNHARIFPFDSWMFFYGILKTGVKAAFKGTSVKPKG